MKEKVPSEIREEITSILDRYSEEQIADMFRLFSLATAYNQLLKIF